MTSALQFTPGDVVEGFESTDALPDLEKIKAEFEREGKFGGVNEILPSSMLTKNAMSKFHGVSKGLVGFPCNLALTSRWIHINIYPLLFRDIELQDYSSPPSSSSYRPVACRMTGIQSLQLAKVCLGWY